MLVVCCIRVSQVSSAVGTSSAARIPACAVIAPLPLTTIDLPIYTRGKSTPRSVQCAQYEDSVPVQYVDIMIVTKIMTTSTGVERELRAQASTGA